MPVPEETAIPGEDVLPGELKIAPPKKMMKKRLIPPRYNSQTELTAKVKAGEPNTYVFDLKNEPEDRPGPARVETGGVTRELMSDVSPLP